VDGGGEGLHWTGGRFFFSKKREEIPDRITILNAKGGFMTTEV